MNAIPERLLKEAEAAELLGVKPSTLRRWRWAGQPPGWVKVGTAVRYDSAEIAAFIEAGRRTSTAETPK